MLWELLKPMAFEMLAHFGRGLEYFICRGRGMAAGFGSRSLLMQRTADL